MLFCSLLLYHEMDFYYANIMLTLQKCCIKKLAHFSYILSDWFNKWQNFPFDQSAGSSHGVKLIGSVWTWQNLKEQKCAKYAARIFLWRFFQESWKILHSVCVYKLTNITRICLDSRNFVQEIFARMDSLWIPTNPV